MNSKYLHTLHIAAVSQSARQKYEVYLETSRSEKEQDRKSKQIEVIDQEIKDTEALRQQADKTNC